MKSRPRAKSRRQKKREFYLFFGVLVALFALVSSCFNAVFGDDEEEYAVPVPVPVATASARPSTVSVPGYSPPAWTIPPQPTRTKTRTAKTARPTPTRTRTKTAKPRPKPKPESPTLASVHPGAYCSTAGARGLYKGRIYTCKGPAPNRWRR